MIEWLRERLRELVRTTPRALVKAVPLPPLLPLPTPPRAADEDAVWKRFWEQFTIATADPDRHIGALARSPRSTAASAWDEHWRAALATSWAKSDLLPIESVAYGVRLGNELRARGASRILVVGNGLDQLPNVLAVMGGDVTVVDISPVACSAARTYPHVERILARYCEVHALTEDRATDPRSLHRTGGGVRYVAGDILLDEIAVGPFDAIYSSRFVHLFMDRLPAVASAFDRRLAAGGLITTWLLNARTETYDAIEHAFVDRGIAVSGPADKDQPGTSRVMRILLGSG